MGERTPEEYVAACEDHGCCPLGAAWKGIDPDGPRNPFPYMGIPLGPLTVARNDAFTVIDAWDGPPGDRYGEKRDRPEAIRLALNLGLRPAMDRYLFPPSPSASRQERGGSEGSAT